MVCPQVALDVDTLVHLSRMLTLTRLNFIPSVTLPASYQPLVGSNLHHVILRAKSLRPTSHLLSQALLFAVTYLTASIGNPPSRQELGSSLLSGVPTSNTGNTIKKLRLDQSLLSVGARRSEALLLDFFEGLRPWMALSNLRYIELDIEFNVGLADTQVLTLASALKVC